MALGKGKEKGKEKALSEIGDEDKPEGAMIERSKTRSTSL